MKKARLRYKKQVVSFIIGALIVLTGIYYVDDNIISDKGQHVSETGLATSEVKAMLINECELEGKFKPHVVYKPLDNLNRVQEVAACLTKDNLGKSEGRDPQVFKPTGWNNQKKTIKGKGVYPQNRGHLLAYTYSFNFDDEGNYISGMDGSLDNPYNLFTQTAYSNQVLFTKLEQQVRDSLKAGKNVYFYVKPNFEGDNLMAHDIDFIAFSKDGSLNIEEVVPNIQPGLIFDYATGKSKVEN